MTLKIEICGELELDLDDEDRIETAWWSWGGLTFAESVIGRA